VEGQVVGSVELDGGGKGGKRKRVFYGNAIIFIRFIIFRVIFM